VGLWNRQSHVAHSRLQRQIIKNCISRSQHERTKLKESSQTSSETFHLCNQWHLYQSIATIIRCGTQRPSSRKFQANLKQAHLRGVQYLPSFSRTNPFGCHRLSTRESFVSRKIIQESPLSKHKHPVMPDRNRRKVLSNLLEDTHHMSNRYRHVRNRDLNPLH
jgi:hypothetical protein